MGNKKAEGFAVNTPSAFFICTTLSTEGGHWFHFELKADVSGRCLEIKRIELSLMKYFPVRHSGL